MISTPSRRAPWTFQSTPPARGATRRRYSRPCSSPYFNPRPPRGGRQRRPKNFRRSTSFQSTPPARGATPGIRPLRHSIADFNPRPPRGGRRYPGRPAGGAGNFNPRPPRGGRQHKATYKAVTSSNFNPRPPRGGRLGWLPDVVKGRKTISIHAPREGGDGGGDVPIIHKGNFNPRPPRGGRRIPAADLSACRPFQSTPPARGATLLEVNKMVKIRIISIHAPREGGDSVKCRSSASSSNNFNPRPPRGGRPNY